MSKSGEIRKNFSKVLKIIGFSSAITVYLWFIPPLWGNGRSYAFFGRFRNKTLRMSGGKSRRVRRTREKQVTRR